jgi:8-oxo-dGTP pyrophosphatase MutT (NUDIX family)
MAQKAGSRAARTPRQVAVIPFRRGPSGLEVCLTRRTDSAKWGIPKGFIDHGDTPEEAVLKEASEEAGLQGDLIGEAIGTYDYKKWNATLTVLVYVMEVREEQEAWLEMRVRSRSWYPVDEAAELLARHPVQPLWHRVTKALARLETED